MKKRRIQLKTCFLLGLAGAAVYAAAGLLMALRLGQAAMLVVAAFVLMGGMLLFLCVLEKGEAKKPLRVKLLVLFLAWMLSYTDLAPLNYLADALMLPLLAVLYRQHKAHTPCFAVLALAEAGRLAARTLGVVDFFAPHTLAVEGAALALVAAARFWMLLTLYKMAAAAPPLVDENAVRKL